MTRVIRVGAAQSGPIQRDDNRKAIVRRLVELMRQAKAQSCDVVVFTEFALTTFFPRYYENDRSEMDTWFESELPNSVTLPLFEYAAENNMGFVLGYAELTSEGRHFNTSILVDKAGKIVGKYRKVHLPGHSAFDPERQWQHLEKRYFEPGDLGFPVWRTMGGVMGMCICNDRRWPETYRVLGLQGVEVVMLGYNTPSTNPFAKTEAPHLGMFHNHLSMQAGAYQNGAWALAAAKAGVEEGVHHMGGSCIISPTGEIVAQAMTEGDEVIIAECDLDRGKYIRETIFNFDAHRRIEHYGLITERTGAIPPPEK